MELKGRTALITGSCGGGMGRSTALRLAQEGANIVLNYGTHRSGKEVQNDATRIAEAIETLGARAIIQQADTRDEQQVRAMAETTCKEFGQVDILVNNSGGDWEVHDYTEISLDHWKSVLSAEIDGTFLMMKHVVPGMREHGWGRIIHIGLSGALGLSSTSYVAPDYCLGKAARAWMTTAFGQQEFSKGISVNCIEPGPTAHTTFEDALQAARGNCSTSKFAAVDPVSGKELWQGLWHQREKPTCHDVAEIIAFLCSEAGRFVSGSIIRLPHV